MVGDLRIHNFVQRADIWRPAFEISVQEVAGHRRDVRKLGHDSGLLRGANHESQ